MGAPQMPAQCMTCRHFQGMAPALDPDDPNDTGTEPVVDDTDPDLEPIARPRCAAFPDGIPVAILVDYTDHRRPVAGDQGIQWQPRDAEATNARAMMYPQAHAAARRRYGATPPVDDA